MTTVCHRPVVLLGITVQPLDGRKLKRDWTLVYFKPWEVLNHYGKSLIYTDVRQMNPLLHKGVFLCWLNQPWGNLQYTSSQRKMGQCYVCEAVSKIWPSSCNGARQNWNGWNLHCNLHLSLQTLSSESLLIGYIILFGSKVSNTQNWKVVGSRRGESVDCINNSYSAESWKRIRKER